MKLEQWNLLNPFWVMGNMGKGDEGEWWLGESNQGTLLAYTEVSQWSLTVQLLYVNKNVFKVDLSALQSKEI
jgi:hypothetical protein